MGKRPLLRAVLFQQGVAEAAVVAEASGGEGREFGIHLLRLRPGEQRCEPQAAAEFGEDRPVGSGLSRRLSKGRAEGDAPFGVGHHPLLFAPLGRRQQQMGHLGGFGAGIGLAQHHQRAVQRRGPHPIQRRQAHQWVGGRHPPEVEFSPFHRLHLVPHRQAGR